MNNSSQHYVGALMWEGLIYSEHKPQQIFRRKPLKTWSCDVIREGTGFGKQHSQPSTDYMHALSRKLPHTEHFLRYKVEGCATSCSACLYVLKCSIAIRCIFLCRPWSPLILLRFATGESFVPHVTSCIKRQEGCVYLKEDYTAQMACLPLPCA